MPTDHTFLIIGATGDLSGRLLLPALARLGIADELPVGFRIAGAGPQPWNVSVFQDHVRARLADHAPDLPTSGRDAFLAGLTYHHVDVLDPAAIPRLITELGGSALLTVYLALPTDLVARAVAALEQSTLPPSVRIAVEKPFGSNLQTARALNAALTRTTAGESQIYRVDHVLGMPTVQDLPAIFPRLGHEPDSTPTQEIAEVSILWEETLALEGRAAFYDGAGALKDLLQNHLLQILCLVTMDSSTEPDHGGLSDRRLAAVRAVQIPTADQARATSRRARYTDGVLASTGGADGLRVPDYSAEQGVTPSRQTETLAEVTLHVATPRWSTTRFVLRAGKALGRRRRGVLIRFRSHTGVPSREDLWIDLDQPDTSRANALSSDIDSAVAPAPLEQIAYVNVLRDLLSGSNSLSVSAEETELAWQIFTPILDQWAARAVPLEEYRAGTTPGANTPGIR